jgi:PAT family beta-lactamase induction signal transducer AmpG
MPPNKILRYAMFGLLYFAQGAVLSYFTALNALYLLSRGLEMTDVGIFSAIALLPFVIKIFFGMVSDRFNLLGMGHRKPYILIGLSIQAVCLVLVAFVDPKAGYGLFVLTAFILMCGQALYDTCTDGLALDTTPPAEQGTVQGIMVGGRALGVVLISGVVGLLAEHVSWMAVFWLLALLTLLPLPLVWQVRETPRPAERTFQWRAFGAFKAAPVIALALLGALYSLIISGANELVNPSLQETFQISLSAAGLFTTVWGIGVVVGGLLGGRLADRIGYRQAVQAALWLAMLTIFPLGFIIHPALAWPLVALFGLAYGLYETVYFAVSMAHSDPRIAASMFSLLMAVANIGTGIGLALGASLADGLGFRWTFVVLAALNLLGLPLLSVIFGGKEKHV